jgi:hypothetical protein
MKDLRTRRGAKLEVDLDGPEGWNRGAAWDETHQLHELRSPLEGLDGGSAGRAG